MLEEKSGSKLNQPCESENFRPFCCSSITVDVSGEDKKSENIFQDEWLGLEI